MLYFYALLKKHTMVIVKVPLTFYLLSTACVFYDFDLLMMLHKVITILYYSQKKKTLNSLAGKIAIVMFSGYISYSHFNINMQVIPMESA